MRAALVAAVMVACSFALGWTVRPQPAKPAPPVANEEQLVRVTAFLVDWLENFDPDATHYDFPNLLGCARVVSPLWLAGGLRCRFGVTYPDESTRRYSVTLTRDNVPQPLIRGRRTHATTAP